MSGRDELIVDPIACVGHGLCAELFPEGIQLDDWGYPMLRPEAGEPRNREHAERAIHSCPALALRFRLARPALGAPAAASRPEARPAGNSPRPAQSSA